MISLNRNGSAAPLTAVEVRTLLEAHRSYWVCILERGSSPYIRTHDAVELVEDRKASTGLAVIEQDGLATLAVGFPPREADLLGWVRQIWRGGLHYRLDRAPWRRILRMRDESAWIRATRLFRRFHRVRYVTQQLRLMPQWHTVEAMVPGTYALASCVDYYCTTARSGLDEGEQLLMDRYLQPGDTLLDVGCGAGREAFGFAERGLQVTAVDVSEETIACARREARLLALDGRISFHRMRVSQLDFPAESFDAIYLALDVYASIPSRQHRVAVLERCRRMAKPGGLVCIGTWVYSSSSRHSRIERVVDGTRRVLRHLLGDRIPEIGDRWLRCNPEPSAPLIYKHWFSTDAEVHQEIEMAGLTPSDRMEDLFIAGTTGRLRRRGLALLNRRYDCHQDVKTEAVGDELLLVHLSQGTTFRLNRTGRAIWEHAVQGQTAEEIAQQLHPRLGVSREQIEQDASELLDELAEGLLLEKMEDTPERERVAECAA